MTGPRRCITVGPAGGTSRCIGTRQRDGDVENRRSAPPGPRTSVRGLFLCAKRNPAALPGRGWPGVAPGFDGSGLCSPRRRSNRPATQAARGDSPVQLLHVRTTIDVPMLVSAAVDALAVIGFEQRCDLLARCVRATCSLLREFRASMCVENFYLLVSVINHCSSPSRRAALRGFP